jgi:hypothetical protein
VAGLDGARSEPLLVILPRMRRMSHQNLADSALQASASERPLWAPRAAVRNAVQHRIGPTETANKCEISRDLSARDLHAHLVNSLIYWLLRPVHQSVDQDQRVSGRDESERPHGGAG